MRLHVLSSNLLVNLGAVSRLPDPIQRSLTDMSTSEPVSTTAPPCYHHIFAHILRTPLKPGFFPDRDDIIAEMIGALGPLPQDWWTIWKARGEFFKVDGSWRTDMMRIHDPISRPLSQRLQNIGRQNDPEFSIEEAESLERMLRAMLEYKPERRATAQNAVKSDWMVRWGIPSLQAFDIPVPCET